MQVDYYGELSHGIVTIVKVFQPIIFKVLASEQLIQFTSQRLFQIYQKQNRHLREEKCKPYETPIPGLTRIGIGLNNCIPWFCFVWDVGDVAFVVL